MEDLCICKICKKVFTDAQGLRKHQMAQHPQKQNQQCNNIISDHLVTQQFRNHSNISITRISSGGGGGKEINNSSVIVVQSGTMSQNQNIFGRKSAGPPSSMKIKQGEGQRVKPPFRSPDQRLKQTGSGNTTSVRQLVSMGLNDDTANWDKWDPTSRDRDVGANQSVPISNRPRNTDGSIITQSAAERAMLAFNDAPAAAATAATARKSVPKLLPMVPQGNKRPTPGAKVSVSSQRPTPGTKVAMSSQRPVPGGGSGGGIRTSVADIMQNLGKMKSINQQSSRAAVVTNQKLISLSQANKGASGAISPKVQQQKQQQTVQQNQPFRVSKPPQVSKSKQKIVPRNAFNNALPRPGSGDGGNASTGQPPSKRLPTIPPPSREDNDDDEEEDDMEVDSPDLQPEEEEEDDDDELEELEPTIQKLQPQVKKSVPQPPVKGKAVGGIGGGGGKAPPQKKNTNTTNRFNPIDPSKKGKGAAKASPNGKSKTMGEASSAAASGKTASTSTSSSTNGTNKQSSVVAKKSSVPPPAPPAKKKKGREDTLKKLKGYVPTMPGSDYDMPKLSAIGSYTNRAGQQVWVCLVCNEKEQEESSRDMICCEMCDDWYHWECVGIRESMAEDDPWYCKRCIYQASSNPKKDFPRIFKNDIFDM